MPTWNVTSTDPNSGTVEYNGNKITFPQNKTNNNIDYTVTYTDNYGYSSSKVVTIPGGCTIDCSKYAFVNKNAVVPNNEGHDYVTAFVAQSSLNEEILSGETDEDWITTVFNIPPQGDVRDYLAYVKNYGGTDSRSGTIIFKSSDGCRFEATVTQLGPSVFTVDQIIYISADGGTAYGNVISTIGGENVGFSVNNSTLQCPSYNGWTVVANTSNSRIDVTAGSTSSSKECGSIQVVQDQTGRYAVFKIIQSAPTAKNITINLIPSENGTVYTSNYYGRTWYVNWKIYYKYDSSKTAVASGTIGYENKTEGQQATYSSTMHVPNLSMPFTEYFVDFTTTTCSIYKANHQLVTPPSICYEGDYMTTYETHMEPLGTFYDRGIFNILTSLI